MDDRRRYGARARYPRQLPRCDCAAGRCRKRPAFEVATVKLAAPGAPSRSMRAKRNGRIIVRGVSIRVTLNQYGSTSYPGQLRDAHDRDR